MTLRQSPAARAATVAGLVLILFAVGIAANFLLTNYEVQRNNHKLCQIVTLVTAHPVSYPADPKANPSRVASYQFYEAFLKVKSEYGC